MFSYRGLRNVSGLLELSGTDLPVPELQELFRAAAHDDPVALGNRLSEQRVPNRSTYFEDLHRGIIPQGWSVLWSRGCGFSSCAV